MARKVVNRKAARAEAEAAEAAEAKAPKKKAKKKATKKRKKAAPEDIRMKLFWGVFNHSGKQVALFEFNQKKQADKKAEQLSEKTPHFVRKVKEAIVEE